MITKAERNGVDWPAGLEELQGMKVFMAALDEIIDLRNELGQDVVTVNTLELNSFALDWAAAVAANKCPYLAPDSPNRFLVNKGEIFRPTLRWETTAPIATEILGSDPRNWEAVNMYLIGMERPDLKKAILRLFVQQKIGNVVSIPAALT